MANLVFKSRIHTNQQKKARVFFCCHPKDFETYFETISNDILEKHDCCIWYDEEPLSEYDEETFFSDLREMQLFVMPVTTNLLSQPNRGLDVEFQFALRNHIPVLPIMMETQLQSLFNNKCGDLQFLDKTNDDVTAISYEDKLEKYLSSVLIEENVAEQIRGAFDAYVFLSYRKKDRLHAQKLMKAIHKYDFCRNIAIWYDEFLKIGENFNLSIQEALEKSKVFVLTVTPNLLEDQNYIMRYEYPAAKQADKEIVPIEAVITNKETLSQKYPNIPSTIDLTNDVLLKNKLEQIFDKDALSEKNDTERDFLIGLAYLEGIDVETNYTFALELITKAAEQGHPKAIKKLVAMYRNGQGVEKDYKTSLYWQEKLVDMLEDDYLKREDIDACIGYMDELWILGDYWYDIFNAIKAKKIYIQMIEVGENYLKKKRWTFFEKKEREKFKKLKRYIAIAYEKTGNMCERALELESAESYYKKALKIKKRGEKGLRKIKDLLSCYGRIGVLYRQRDEYLPSIRAFNKCLKLSDNIYRQTQDRSSAVITIIYLGSAYFKWAKFLKKNKYIETAKQCWLQGIAWGEKAYEEDKTNLSILDSIVCCYNFLGMAESDLIQQRKYHLKALEYIELFLQKRRSLEGILNKTMTLTFLGASLDDTNLDGKKKYAVESLELRLELYNIDKNSYTVVRLSEGYVSVGYIYKLEKDLKSALEYYKKAQELLDAWETKTPEVKGAIAYVLFMIAMIDNQSPNTALLKNCTDIYEELLKESSAKKSLWKNNLDQTYRILEENGYKFI